MNELIGPFDISIKVAYLDFDEILPATITDRAVRAGNDWVIAPPDRLDFTAA
jgi:hypothetical protein